MSVWCEHCRDRFDRSHYGEDGNHLGGADFGPTGALLARVEQAERERDEARGALKQLGITVIP